MSQHDLNRLCEDMKKFFSKEGFEMASLGTESLQVKTPGIIYNVGTLMDQIKDLNENAIVDATTENGHLELLVTLPSQTTTSTTSETKEHQPYLLAIVISLSLVVVFLLSYIIYSQGIFVGNSTKP